MNGLDTPHLAPPEVVTGVVQHEYFKFQLQKQVEEQVQAYLSARAKLAATLATVALTALGAFGVRQYATFTSIVEEVQKKSRDLDAEIARTSELAKQAGMTLAATEPLLQAARDNAQNSRTITESANVAAQQTSQIARSVLDQVQITQQDVIS